MSRNIKGCFSHNTDDWRTPTPLYETLMDLYFVDPCPFKSEVDNIQNTYFSKRIYINPPYSDIKSWVKFIYRNYFGNHIILLIPSRTDTVYFSELLRLYPTLIFIKGRLKFNDIGCAPFPSVMMIFDNKGSVLNLDQESLLSYLYKRYGSL